MLPGLPGSRTERFARWWRNWKLPGGLESKGGAFMPKRPPNHRLVKIHRNYTVEEVARRLSVHENTVRAWIKAGLPTCDTRRPTLILGSELGAFLKARRTKNKRPCQAGEMYCVKCRAPKHPAGSMAEYRPITEHLGNLMGICPDCERMMFRRASRAKLARIEGKLDITFAEAERQVSKRECPSVNSDFSKGEQL